MVDRGGGDEAVEGGQLAARLLVPCVKCGPGLHDGCVHRENAAGGPALDSLIPMLDFLPALAPVHEVNALEHLAQGKGGKVKLRIVVPEPFKHRGFGARLGGLTQDVCVNEVGHGKLLKTEVAGGGGIAFGSPILHRAVAQDFHELFLRLEPRISLCRNDHRDGFAMPGNGLGAVLEHGLQQFAEPVFCVMKRPRRIHASRLARQF